MKNSLNKVFLAGFLFFASILFAFINCSPSDKKESKQTLIHKLVSADLDSLQQWLQNDWLTTLDSKGTTANLQQSFLEGHSLYKHCEWAIEYFFPSTAKSINGAPLPEIEPEEHVVIDPIGFQVIEEMIFPSFDRSSTTDLRRETKKLQSVLLRAKDLWKGNRFRDDQVFDALRLELYRIITLGISGFDLPVSLQSIPEINSALQSIEEVLAIYHEPGGIDESKALIHFIKNARRYSNGKSFDAFDRMHFIVNYINPISTQLLSVQKKLNIPVLTGISALRGDAQTLFSTGAFDVNYFTPDQHSWISEEKIALGKKLFYDPILSQNKKTSCASCHKPELAFTDGMPKSRATGSRGFLMRNSPSLINAGYQHGQFYDMRSTYLEDQVKDVVLNKDEIHGSLELSALSLNKDHNYFPFFQKAFPLMSAVEPAHIQVAIGAYIRSLSGFNSRFDQYMRGEAEKMNLVEIEGFNLFMGKAKCGTCHFMPLFNGTVPPSYTSSESEVLGVPEKDDGKKLDKDPGRFAIYKIPEFQSSFKTPSIRNIELTAPYMHNGVYKTLDQVMDFYNRGGGRGLGLHVPYQTLPEDPLNLSHEEQQKIIAFMKTLTDTSAIHY